MIRQLFLHLFLIFVTPISGKSGFERSLIKCSDAKNPWSEGLDRSIRNQYHCVDVFDGRPAYVRGTYSMIGYFEGPINSSSGTASTTWFVSNSANFVQVAFCITDACRFHVSSSLSAKTGRAYVEYSLQGRDVSVNGSNVGEWQGTFGSPDCTLISNASQEDFAKWCFASPQSVASSNNSRATPTNMDRASFSSVRGRNDFCFGNPSDSGRYLYAYEPAECQVLGLPCTDQGQVEEGFYQSINPSGSMGVRVGESFLYLGGWYATSGPGEGLQGSSIYAEVLDEGGNTSLRGFYCYSGRCFSEQYALNARRKTCVGAAAAGPMSPEILVVTIVSAVCALILIVLAVAFVAKGSPWLGCFGSEEDEAEVKLRAKIAELRVRFHIRQVDGYVLSTDPPPLWWWPGAVRFRKDPPVILHVSGLEAAAHLALWEDFDVDQFDAFCLLLKEHQGNVAPKPRWGASPSLRHRDVSKQFEAIRCWLLEVTTALLDPKEPEVEYAAFGRPMMRHHKKSSWYSSYTKQLLGAPTKLTAESTQAQRFRYVERLVCKARIWRESESLFDDLKVNVQEFMDQVAKQCDARYENLATEPCGPELVALESPEFEKHVEISLAPTPFATPCVTRNARVSFCDGVETNDLKKRLTSVFGAITWDSANTPTCGAKPSYRPRYVGDESCKEVDVENVPPVVFSSFRSMSAPESPALELLRDIKQSVSNDEVGRQDHPKIGAIRVDEADRKEARMESVTDTNNHSRTDHGILNEEIFVAQLHRRAELLNEGFHDKVLAVVHSHTDEADLGPCSSEESNSKCEQKIRRTSVESVGRRRSSDRRLHVSLMNCRFEGGVKEQITVYLAPVKTVGRMREKLVEYAAPHPACTWPLCANILDPVRTSIICRGPSQILQMASWFASASIRLGSPPSRTESGNFSAAAMPVCRIKNRFAYPRDAVPDGYRDLKIFVIYTGDSGLRIIGEIQIHDRELFYLKQKMHKLYKVKRATRFDQIAS